jgi:hypothetical protein
MYGKSFPVLSLEAQDFATLRTGDRLSLLRDGRIVTLAPSP